MDSNFNKSFTFGSFLAIVLFLLGNYILYLILTDNVSTGVFLMVIALIIYVLNNVVVNIFSLESSFNDFLENVAVMITFGLSTIVFGVMYYDGTPVLLTIILFYAVCLLLSLGRNNVMSLKNSIGWPVPLNGIFFPIVYFFYLFYFNDSQNTIFIFYYVTVAILSVSSYNFLGNIDAQSLAEKQDMRYKAFKNDMSKRASMNKYKQLLHHEEVKQQQEAEKIFQELDKASKKQESQQEVEKALKSQENNLGKIIKTLVQKFHWIRKRDIPTTKEEIQTIEEDIKDIRTNKIKKDEIEEVFLDKQPSKKKELKKIENKKKGKLKLPFKKNYIQDISPDDIKEIPRIPIEEVVHLSVDDKKEEVKEEEKKSNFKFEHSTFENKKRL